jgi:hypothetical protein
VDVKKPSTGQYHEATLLRITDMSSYTVGKLLTLKLRNNLLRSYWVFVSHF